MTTKKRQFSFHADDDVADYLDSLDSGLKTKKINEHIRTGMNSIIEQLEQNDARDRKIWEAIKSQENEIKKMAESYEQLVEDSARQARELQDAMNQPLIAEQIRQEREKAIFNAAKAAMEHKHALESLTPSQQCEVCHTPLDMNRDAQT